MVVERFTEAFSEYLPAFLRDPSIFIPIIVAFYVGLLGFCLTGALNRQKVEIRKTRTNRSEIFSMLDEDDDDDDKRS